MTGIVGVNRDPMGTGMGANLLCNTDVFCFADPFYEGESAAQAAAPAPGCSRAYAKAWSTAATSRASPTVNGSIVFDERYFGKPLVYCGTIGTMPVLVSGKPLP